MAAGIWEKGSLFSVHTGFGRLQARMAPRDIATEEKAEQAEKNTRVGKILYTKEDLKELREWGGKARRAVSDLAIPFPEEGDTLAWFVTDANESAVVTALEAAEEGFRAAATRFKEHEATIRARRLAEAPDIFKPEDFPPIEDRDIRIWHVQYRMEPTGSDQARADLVNMQRRFVDTARTAMHETALKAVNKAIENLESGKPVSEVMFNSLRSMMRNLQAFNGLTDESALQHAIDELRLQIDAQHAQTVKDDDGFLQRFRRGLTMVVEAANVPETASAEDPTFLGRAIEVG